MEAIADALKARTDELARNLTLENGKPVEQSEGEVGMAADHFEWFAGEAQRGYGRIVPNQDDGKRHLIMKRPVGVSGLISPWNFPLVLSARKAAPALAAGCTVVLKPSSRTPMSGLALAEAAEEVGLPPGVLNVVVGDAKEIADTMMHEPACRKISFTGSTEVGKDLIRASADGVKNVSMELGGHAPVIVFDDADMEKAVEGALITKFRNTGQSCIAANRIYVQRDALEEFLERFVEETKKLAVGPGIEGGMDVGPLIDERSLEGALEHVRDAEKRGARVLCGGNRLDEYDGYFMEPTILADVPEESLCMTQETFAPIAPVVAFDSEEEAITRANDTIYGLSSYAFTSDLSRMFRLGERLEAGTVGINDAVPSTSQCPFGGMKQSGVGRELGLEGMDAFLETKHVSIGL
jgi:succinate-semialdehyde dehydrogenase/glutarate-semialdehyde dehydrogenase